MTATFVMGLTSPYRPQYVGMIRLLFVCDLKEKTPGSRETRRHIQRRGWVYRSMDARDWLAERFEEHRPRLRAVAYRVVR